MMQDSGQRRCLVLAAAAVLICVAGCAGRARVYRDLSLRREQAYQRWLGRARDEEMLPRLEGGLSLEDAVKVGLGHSTMLASALEERSKVRGDLMEAYAEGLPTVELSAAYTRLDQITVVDLGAATFPIGDKDNYSYTLSITQPLFKGGAIPSAIKGARLLRYLNDEVVRAAVQDVIRDVAAAYYAVLLAERLLEVQEEALRFSEANLRDVIARRDAGTVVRFDVLRAEVEVSNVTAELIRQRNQLDRARTALFKAMGVSQLSEVMLLDELVRLPLEPDFAEAVSVAFRNRPELFQGELQVDLDETALRVLYSDYLPELEAWAWETWAKPDPHEATNIEWDRQWQAGVRLEWTLFDGLRREGRIVRQRAALRQALVALTEAEQTVLQELKDAILDLRDADELVASQQLNLERAQEALRLVQVGVQEGVNTNLEVLDARAALTRARGLYYESLFSHSIARLALQRAMGLLGSAPGAEDVPAEPPPVGVVKAFVAEEQEAPGPQGEAGDETVTD